MKVRGNILLEDVDTSTGCVKARASARQQGQVRTFKMKSMRLISGFMYISLLNMPVLIAKAAEACDESGPANQAPYYLENKNGSFCCRSDVPGTLIPCPYNYYPVFQPLLGVSCVLITA